MGMDAPVSELVRQIRHYSKQEFAEVLNGILGEKLPNRPVQHIDQVSDIANYVVGSRKAEGLTVYRYARMAAGSSIAYGQQHRGVVNSNLWHEQNLAVDAEVGDTSITIVDAAAAAHEYANGKIILFQVAALEWQAIDIVDNEASDGVNTVLRLNRPVRVAAAAGETTVLLPNPYSAITPPTGDGYETFMGVGQRYVPDGNYFWLPTWGAVNIVCGAPMGDVIQTRQVVFDVADGSIEFARADYDAIDGRARQFAGYLLPHTDAVLAPHNMVPMLLQLDP